MGHVGVNECCEVADDSPSLAKLIFLVKGSAKLLTAHRRSINIFINIRAPSAPFITPTLLLPLLEYHVCH